MSRDTFDDFLQKQVRRVRQSLNPPAPTRDADFPEQNDLAVSARGNTKGRMGRKCGDSDSQGMFGGGPTTGKRRREIPVEDRAYWDYYKPPTTGSRFPWK